MEETIPFDIYIGYEHNVSMAVIVDAVSMISAAAVNASHDILCELGQTHRIDEKILAMIHEAIDKVGADVLWLEQAQAGSFKGYGTLVVPILCAMIGLVPTLVAQDFPGDKDNCAAFIQAVEQAGPAFKSGLKAHCEHHQNGLLGNNSTIFEVDMDAGVSVRGQPPAHRRDRR